MGRQELNPLPKDLPPLLQDYGALLHELYHRAGVPMASLEKESGFARASWSRAMALQQELPDSALKVLCTHAKATRVEVARIQEMRPQAELERHAWWQATKASAGEVGDKEHVPAVRSIGETAPNETATLPDDLASEEPQTADQTKPTLPAVGFIRRPRLIAAVGAAALALLVIGVLVSALLGDGDQANPSVPNPVAQSEVGSTTTESSAVGPCLGETCLGKDPKDVGCALGSQTLAEKRAGPVLVELRYSAACQTVWGKITGAKVDDTVEVISQNGARRSAKVIVANDKYTSMIPGRKGEWAQACVTTTENIHDCTAEFVISEP